MKKFQRVLYTAEFTDDLKKKLRIVRYDKRKSMKGNVYYVGFSSEADAEYATKLSKKIPNVTIKCFQPKNTSCSSSKQATDENPSSSCEFPSLPSALTYLAENWYCNRSSSHPSTNHCTNETLVERGERLLGLRFPVQSLPLNRSIVSKPSIRLIERQISPTDNLKRILLEEIKSCIAAVNRTRQVIDDFCRLNVFDNKRDAKLQHLFQIYSTAYYLKAAISSQLKVAIDNNIQFHWTGIVDIIDPFKMALAHEQLLKEKTTLTSDFTARIDLDASIALTAKIIYQLSKISF